MKKIVLLASILTGTVVFGQGIKFEESKFSEILAKARKENKLIFIDAYTTWCGPCKLMVKNIFPIKSVGDYYNSHFINAKLDMEKGEGLDIAKKYNVKAFPSYLFIDGNGEEVHRTLGYMEEKDFIQFAKDAEDPNKRLTALKQKFENGESDPEFLKNLANLTVYNDTEFANKVLERYFKAKPALDEENMSLLFMTMKNTDASTYKIFQERKADILKVVPEKNYDQMDKGVKIATVISKAYNTETKVLNEPYFLTETQKFVKKEESEKLLNKFRANRALKDKDFATYEKITLEMYKDFSVASSEELNALAWNFFENVNTKSSLEKAVAWAQESVKKNQSFANTDTLANLYNKIGDKKNAKLWAEKSIELAKSTGQDSTDTQKLLDSLK